MSSPSRLPGAPRDLLLHRFAEAVRIDPACLEVADGDPASNVSVGMAEAEVLRQLNLGLGGRLNERQYTRLVNHAVKPALQRRRASAPIVLPDDDRAWVGERCDAMVRELDGAGYHVLGSLDDLRGAPNRSVDGSGATEPAPAEMVDAAVAALVSVSEAYATSWWRSRRQQTAVATTRSARLASWEQIGGVQPAGAGPRAGGPLPAAAAGGRALPAPAGTLSRMSTSWDESRQAFRDAAGWFVDSRRTGGRALGAPRTG
jgi:hypothetical protein